MEMEYREYFDSGQTRDAELRKEVLNACLSAVTEKKDIILESLMQDLGLLKPECLLYYYSLIEHPLKYAAGFAGNALKPSCEVPRAPYIISLARTYYNPVGLVLIDPDPRAPFLHSYAVFLLSLAAGNCTVFRFAGKESATASILTEHINKCIPEGFGRILFANEECPISVPDLKLGGLDFTEDGEAEAAGRAIAVFDAGAELDKNARKVVYAWKKAASLTEIAPEVVLVPTAVRDTFAKNFDKWHRRKSGMEAPEKLPVIGYTDDEDLWRHLEKEGRPAALYVFCADGMLKDRIVADVPFVAGCVNGTSMRPPDLKEMRHRLLREKTLTMK
ncbi:MAG: hypothetical protein Q4A32_04110 [Lachnospiraceae bacterium]|nr:hypothetical protein [Lachnospiraceae bacterium]